MDSQQPRTLDQIEAEINQADDIMHRAATKKQALIDEHDQIRVAAMDPALVEEARRIGVNPANFSDTQHLQEGITIYKRDQEIASPPIPEQLPPIHHPIPVNLLAEDQQNNTQNEENR